MSREYRPRFAFTAGTTAEVEFNISGEPYADLEREARDAFARADDPTDPVRWCATPGVQVSAEEFGELSVTQRLGRWGDEDERGALHHLTAERVAAAAALVREGAGSHSQPPPEYAFRGSQSRARGPLHDGHPAGSTSARGRCTSSRTMSASTTTTMATRTSTRCATSPMRTCSTTPRRRVRSRPTERRSTPSMSSRTDWSDGAYSSTSRACDISRLRGERWLEPGEHVFREDLEDLEAAESSKVSPSAQVTSCS